jgi:hypothetical protein
MFRPHPADSHPLVLASRTVLMHLLHHYQNFPSSGGVARIVSDVSEFEDSPLESAGAFMTVMSAAVFRADNVEFFVLGSSMVLSLVDLPSTDTQPAAARLIVRDMTGRYAVDFVSEQTTQQYPSVNSTAYQAQFEELKAQLAGLVERHEPCSSELAAVEAEATEWEIRPFPRSSGQPPKWSADAGVGADSHDVDMLQSALEFIAETGRGWLPATLEHIFDAAPAPLNTDTAEKKVEEALETQHAGERSYLKDAAAHPRWEKTEHWRHARTRSPTPSRTITHHHSPSHIQAHMRRHAHLPFFQVVHGVPSSVDSKSACSWLAISPLPHAAEPSGSLWMGQPETHPHAGEE